MLETLAQDLRFGVRTLRRNPAFTLAAACTLALGIGGNVVLFSVVNAVIAGWTRTFADPDRLVMVWQRKGTERWAPTPADFRDWREQSDAFTGLGAYHYESAALSGSGDPERVRVARVSGNLLELLGVRPAAGRLLHPEEDGWGRHQVVVLSQSLWSRRFGADPAAIGRSLDLDGVPHTIVGVLPAGGWFAATPVDLFAPMAFAPGDPRNDRHSHFIRVVGRLRPGISLERTNASMAAIAGRLAGVYPENAGLSAGVEPLREVVLGEIEPALAVLFGAVALVLLIACANVANLLLARVTGREREIGVRLSLGATRARLVRQLLTESGLLAVLGGALGILLAVWGVGAAGRFVPANVPRVHEVGVALDMRVLAFAAALSALTGIVFGLVPALQSTRPDLNSALKEGSRGSEGSSRRRRARGVLVVAETGLALILVAGAGLLIRTFMRLQLVEPGTETVHLLTMRVELPFARAEDHAGLTSFF
ncbi:MAG TPA: ABC transporter permease, partial [Vicinamibacteria bacterium]